MPELLNGLEVTDTGTPQPPQYVNDGSAEQSPHLSNSRRGSIAQPDQGAYASQMHDMYGGQNAYMTQDQPAYAPQEHHMTYPLTGQDPYTCAPDVYSQMDKGDNPQHVEPHRPMEMQPYTQSTSSELAFALHPQGNMVSLEVMLR